MQRAIMNSNDRFDPVRGVDSSDQAARMQIYAFAYRSRLQEALAHNFPVLQSHLGESAFAALAGSYIEAHPSTFVSIRAFGDRFAPWLATQRPSEPWLHEFATLEWRLGCAFDAPNDSAVRMNAFAALSPEDWPHLKLTFARSIWRLDLATNAAELYGSSVESGSIVAGRIDAQPEPWLIWRHDLVARYRSMTALEALAFDALASGETFGAACEDLLDFGSEEEVPTRAASYLKRWIADELIVTFSCAQA